MYNYESIETYDVDPNIIGDGVCQLFLNVTKCGYDGGDCLGVEEPPQECTVDHPEYLGDGKKTSSYFSDLYYLHVFLLILHFILKDIAMEESTILKHVIGIMEIATNGM